MCQVLGTIVAVKTEDIFIVKVILPMIRERCKVNAGLTGARFGFEPNVEPARGHDAVPQRGCSPLEEETGAHLRLELGELSGDLPRVFRHGHRFRAN